MTNRAKQVLKGAVREQNIWGTMTPQTEAPSGVDVWYEEGCHLPSWLEGLGESREVPQRGPMPNLDRKHMLAYFEGHITLLFVPTCIYVDALSS